MPYNLPNFDVQRISIGPAIIYVGAAGQTPTIDLGAVYEADLKITAEDAKFFAGSPAGLQWRQTKKVEATLTVKGLEWNLSTWQKTLGGYFGEEGNVETLYATGDIVDSMSLRAVHQTPSGGTIIIDFFKALPSSAPEVTFGFSPHQIPFTFSAVVAKYDFAGNALPANTMFKIVFQKPA